MYDRNSMFLVLGGKLATIGVLNLKTWPNLT